MQDPQQLWQAVLGELELNLSKANFTTWFKNTAISSIENGHAIISVPNSFNQTWIKQKFHDYILKTLKILTQNNVTEITYNVAPIRPKIAVYQQEEKEPQVQYYRNNQVFGINPKYQFHSFIVGKSNELAHAASQAVCEKPGRSYNPLFIYGGVGLGKTHLVQSIGNYYLK